MPIFSKTRYTNQVGYRPLQREVITAVVEGHDVFLQASTSFGKSLCFQLPAVISNGRECQTLIHDLADYKLTLFSHSNGCRVPFACFDGNTVTRV